MAALLLSNRKLLQELGEEIGMELEKWDYPHIRTVTSIVGLLDTSSWKDRFGAIVIQWVLENYRNPKKLFRNRITLGDFENIPNYPKTFILAGDQDPLVESSRTVHELLRKNQQDSRLKIYASHHGFFSFPPLWIDHSHSRQAVEDIIQHLEE